MSDYKRCSGLNFNVCCTFYFILLNFRIVGVQVVPLKLLFSNSSVLFVGYMNCCYSLLHCCYLLYQYDKKYVYL